MSRQMLLRIYELLFDDYGPQHWWPADGPFEVCVGAILTQATVWVNVEKVINNLKHADILAPIALCSIPIEELADLLHCCGYYNAKAKKLKAFVEHLKQYHHSSLAKMFNQPTSALRQELLSIHGIGEETADSMMLYAAKKPVFVIDAYTRRIFSRIGFLQVNASYTVFQSLFMANLPDDTILFNEYHALLVNHGKKVCKKTPLCSKCCIRVLCQYESR